MLIRPADNAVDIDGVPHEAANEVVPGRICGDGDGDGDMEVAVAPVADDDVVDVAPVPIIKDDRDGDGAVANDGDARLDHGSRRDGVCEAGAGRDEDGIRPGGVTPAGDGTELAAKPKLVRVVLDDGCGGCCL